MSLESLCALPSREAAAGLDGEAIAAWLKTVPRRRNTARPEVLAARLAGRSPARVAAGLPCAWTRPSRRTRAGATATTLQNTVTSPVRIRSVPPMTSADRSPSPTARPLRSGDATSSSRNATTRPPPSPLCAVTGRHGTHGR